MSQEAPGDFHVESNGLTILVDPSTSERSDGLTLDFKDGDHGGIIIDNPNEPPSVRRLDVHGYKAMRDQGTEHHLFDVRTAEELAIARIEGGVLLDDAGITKLQDLDADATIVVYCHHGIRSMQAAGQLLSQGFKNIYNLDGGIDAWSLHVDPSVPRY